MTFPRTGNFLELGIDVFGVRRRRLLTDDGAPQFCFPGSRRRIGDVGSRGAIAEPDPSGEELVVDVEVGVLEGLGWGGLVEVEGLDRGVLR